MLPIGVQRRNHARAVGEGALDPDGERGSRSPVARVRDQHGARGHGRAAGSISRAVVDHVDDGIAERRPGSGDHVATVAA
jgi:hypothetical protein